MTEITYKTFGNPFRILDEKEKKKITYNGNFTAFCVKRKHQKT